MNNQLDKEAFAFDTRIKERMNQGHIPDLRKVKACHYFYNNVWRDPTYVKLSIEPRLFFILNHIKKLDIASPKF